MKISTTTHAASLFVLRIHKRSFVKLTFLNFLMPFYIHTIICKQTHQLDLTGKINNSLQFATQSAIIQSRLIKIFYDVRLRIAISSNTFHWLFHSNCHRKLRHWLSPADLLERWSIKYYLTDLVRERREEGNNPQFFFLTENQVVVRKNIFAFDVGPVFVLFGPSFAFWVYG